MVPIVVAQKAWTARHRAGACLGMVSSDSGVRQSLTPVELGHGMRGDFLRRVGLIRPRFRILQDRSMPSHAPKGLGVGLWIFAGPAAATVLARIDDAIGLTDFFAFIISAWRSITQAIWGSLFAWIQRWLTFPEPTPAQRDLLTLAVLLVGSSLAARAWSRVRYHYASHDEVLQRMREEASTREKEVQFSACFVLLLWVFIAPPFSDRVVTMLYPQPGYAPDTLSWQHLLVIAGVGVVILMTAFTAQIVLSDIGRGINVVGRVITLMCCFLFALMLSDVSRLDSLALVVSVAVGVVLAVAFDFIVKVSPRSLVRVVVFAIAVFVVDRLVWLTEPVGRWLEQIRAYLPT